MRGEAAKNHALYNRFRENRVVLEMNLDLHLSKTKFPHQSDLRYWNGTEFLAGQELSVWQHISK